MTAPQNLMYMKIKYIYHVNLNVTKRLIISFILLKVTETQKNIVSHKEQLDEHSDRIYAMSEHLRNVQQELQHTQVNRKLKHSVNVAFSI